MNYLIEALLVGVNALLVYLVLQDFIHESVLLLLLVGFFKYLLGHLFSLHDYYCNNGNACILLHKKDGKFISTSENLIRNSILEGLYFVILSYLYFRYENDYYARAIFIFLLGTIKHIIFEFAGVNSKFCVDSCKKL